MEQIIIFKENDIFWNTLRTKRDIVYKCYNLQVLLGKYPIES